MTYVVGSDILAVFAQPSEPLALALALLFNRYGWDTDAIDRVDGQYHVRMRKELI